MSGWGDGGGSGSWGVTPSRPSGVGLSERLINSSSSGGGAGGGGGGSGEQGGGGMDLFSRVAMDIEQIAGASTTLRQLTASVRAQRHLTEVKNRCVRLENAVEASVRSGGDGLQKLHATAGTSSQARHRVDKLSRQYKMAVQEYRAETQAILAAMKQEGARRLSVHRSSATSAGSMDDGTRGSYEAPKPQQAQAQLQVVPVQIQQQDEQLADLQALEADLAELGELFENVALLTKEQGNTLNQIETFANESVVRVEKGIDELAEAKALQKSARKKMCCIICCLIIIVGVFLGIFGGVFKFQV